MKKFFVLIFLFVFSFPGQVLASTAKSVVETQVEAGEAQIYQSVETTVNGETVKKESTQPGKLELEMKKTGEAEPTVSFSQETVTPSPFLSPTPTFQNEKSPVSFIAPILKFFQNLFSGLMLRFTQHQP